jgi:hypothetical protein
MQKVKYIGPAGNVGRFGMLNPGDAIVLTSREFACVEKDKRFAKVADDYTAPPAKPDATLTPEEREAQLNADAARKESIDNANARALDEEIAQLTKEEILERLTDLDKQGKALKFNKRDHRKALAVVLLSSLRGGKREEPES